jgi:SAM-dependent methyltransferase
VLTPSRRRGVELIDDPAIDPAVVVRSLRDVARSNTLFGGRRAVLRALEPMLRASRGATLTLLDVGAGVGDIPARASRAARRHGVRLHTLGVELSEPLARACAHHVDLSIRADAFALPLADASVDVVTCSQVLHHFVEDDAARLVRELTRVARRLVVVGDLRRSWLAAGGFWLAAWALRFHPVTRHDGVVSVLRGFTAPELRRLVEGASGRRPTVRRRLGWRVVAAWEPRAAADRPGVAPGAALARSTPYESATRRSPAPARQP